jgi:hypothetical protein
MDNECRRPIEEAIEEFECCYCQGNAYMASRPLSRRTPKCRDSLIYRIKHVKSVEQDHEGFVGTRLIRKAWLVRPKA